MKKILINIAVIFLIVLIFDRLFSFVFTKYIFEKTISGESGGSLNYLLEKKKNADYIILGSSRAKHQVDPEKLTAINGIGYNAGINGVGTILHSNIVLDIMLHENFKPKIILLQVDAVNFATENLENYLYGLSSLYPFFKKSPLLQNSLKELALEERLKLNFDTYKFNGKITNIFLNYFKQNSVAKNDGFDPLYQTMDTINQQNLSFAKFTFSAKKLQILNNIITSCKQNNIQLVIIFPPYYKNVNYREDEIIFLKKYIKNISGKVVIIDMGNVTNLPEIQDAQNWKDIGHLNNIGAAKFSASLNDSIKKYFP
ncbi:hypothetical protein [Ferruginibacter sp.]